MRPFERFTAVVALTALASCVSCVSCVSSASRASGPSPIVAAPISAAPRACDVWAREVSFARTVHDHDAAAFTEHVHPGAVFLDGEGTVLRGRDAITKGWAPLISGERTRLDWHPTSVVLTGDPHVALSRGPYWVEVVRPDAPTRFLRGLYQSVWLLEADGVWRVAIDGGTPPPVAATAGEIEALKASIPTRCTSDG